MFTFSKFWKVRMATFVWGFLVIYWFTGKLDLTSKAFLIQALGNTLIMYFFLEWKSAK